MKTLLFGLALMSSVAQATVVFHEVDTQLTFWEASHGSEAGPLAVPGSKALENNIANLKRMTLKDKSVKAIASVDYHFDMEVQNPEIFPEFKIFKAHGMALKSGPLGAGRIPEVLIYPESKIYNVEHHQVVDGKWIEVAQELDKEKVLDDAFEVVIRKNGLNSYNVFSNPKAEQIYSIINPKAVFVYGVATDFCVHAAVMGLRERGYVTYVIQDAIAGIFPDQMAERTKEMKAAGAVFISAKEVGALVKSLK
jgi:nicotinamidase-related amidase